MPSFTNVTITAYSSLQEERADWLRALVGLIQDHFGLKGFMEGEFVDDAGKTKRGRSISQLTNQELEGRLLAGGFSFIGGERRDVSGFVSNERFRIAGIGVPQLEVGLTLPSNYGSDPNLAISVREFCQALARHAKCNLVFCADSEHFDVQFDTALHIGIGLLDVYWITVYGPAYMRLMDTRKFSSIDAHFVSCEADGYGIIQLCETLEKVLEPAGETIRHAVRDSLGNQFFAKPRCGPNRARGTEASAWQFWKVISLFRKQNDAFKDTSRRADVVPDFKLNPASPP
jgi:hypothetical protein